MKAITSLALAALGLAMPGAALAGANKTWVSGSGVDSGTCQFAAPCRSFQYALTQTSAGGEIDVKDAGGYGTVVIDKAISIVAADGALATISVPAGGTGIMVKAGISDLVVISGLTIDGHLLGGDGIVLQSSALLTKLTIRNLNFGIHVTTLVDTVKDSTISHNLDGIHVDGGAVVIDNNVFVANGYAVNNSNHDDTYSYGNNTTVANYKANFAVQPVSASKL